MDGIGCISVTANVTPTLHALLANRCSRSQANLVRQVECVVAFRPAYSRFLGCFGHDQLLERDREPTNANASCVPHGIGDRARRTRNADLTNAFDA